MDTDYSAKRKAVKKKKVFEQNPKVDIVKCVRIMSFIGLINVQPILKFSAEEAMVFLRREGCSNVCSLLTDV